MSEQLPKETAFTVADALAYLRTDQSDVHDRLCADIIEIQARELVLYTDEIERLQKFEAAWRGIFGERDRENAADFVAYLLSNQRRTR